MDLYNISPINIVDLYNIYISVNAIYYLYTIGGQLCVHEYCYAYLGYHYSCSDYPVVIPMN
jgi:hypothetical protein